MNEGFNMAEAGCVAVLEQLKDQELKDLLENVTLITDPLGQALISHAADSHSPIPTNAIPTVENYCRDEALMRLYQLEKLCIFESAFNVIEGKTVKMFSITDFGRKTVMARTSD